MKGKERAVAGSVPQSKAEEKRTAEIEEAARRYAELKRAMPDMMFVVDGTGCFLDANDRFTRRLGYEPAELGQKKLYEVVEDEAEDPRQRMMPFFARNGGVRALRTKEGERVWVMASSVGRYDDAGRFSGAVVVCREVPAGEAKTEAIARAAQEMNQPLSGICGYSELLKGSVGPRDPAYKYARKIYEQGERLAALVRQIKSEQGAPPEGLIPGEQPRLHEQAEEAEQEEDQV
jgi:PAS domain S-box-containing protein